jgi:hypothetical protein
MKIFATLLLTLLIPGTLMSTQAAEKLNHVVSFKFKSTASPEEIRKVEQAFGELKKKISQVQSYEWGTNVSKENRDKGFTHCFILTFKSEKDRDAYIQHPEHAAFVKVALPSVDDVFVIDFWASKQ